ncbi:hypothetical protein Mapa_004645 [Marchantia paleacea]|nr:hypothetical protein Mapa_004645 [Marchantia paleacea]
MVRFLFPLQEASVQREHFDSKCCRHPFEADALTYDNPNVCPQQTEEIRHTVSNVNEKRVSILVNFLLSLTQNLLQYLLLIHSRFYPPVDITIADMQVIEP